MIENKGFLPGRPARERRDYGLGEMALKRLRREQETRLGSRRARNPPLLWTTLWETAPHRPQSREIACCELPCLIIGHRKISTKSMTCTIVTTL
jgi:hypothetical protein